MCENMAKYQCLACERVWNRSQLLGDELNKTCGDAFCGANVRQIAVNKMTTNEATTVVKEIVRTANSENEIRERLNEAGFNGAAAAVTSTRSGPMFMAMVMVWGPKGETIRA